MASLRSTKSIAVWRFTFGCILTIFSAFLYIQGDTLGLPLVVCFSLGTAYAAFNLAKAARCPSVVDAALAQFPAPVSLRGSGRALALSIFGPGAAFVLLLVGLDATNSLTPFILWGMIALAIGVMAFGIARYQPMTLLLAPDTFQLGQGRREQRIAWSGVEGFTVALTQNEPVAEAVVICRTGAGQPGGAPAPLAVPDTIVAATFGLTASELSRLLNVWRKRALAGPV